MENQKLPNATAVLILGIFSILTCCCWGVIGLALGIIALVLAKKDTALYNANPTMYVDYKNLNTGRILAIIGVVLSSIYLLYTIYMFAVVGAAGMAGMQEDLLRQLQNK